MKLSLKLRLSLFVAAGTALLAGGAAFGIWNMARNAAERETDTMLRSPGRRLTERTGWDTNWKNFDQSLQLVFGDDWQQLGTCRVIGRGPEYRDYYQSPNWPEDVALRYPEPEGIAATSNSATSDTLFSVREPILYDAESHDGRRWRFVNLANSDLTIHLGIQTSERDRGLKSLANKLTTGTIVLPLFMFGLTWLIARRSLRPVDEIAAATESLTAKRLDQRIGSDHHYEAEFERLTKVLNAMIDRLERSFQQAARFSADASHELKTPITNLFAEVASRLDRCEPGSDEQKFLAGQLHELDRLRSILSGLLLLSRADSGLLQLSREKLSIGTFLAEICEDARGLAEDAGLRFESNISPSEDATISGDPVMLSQAIHNLLRNAIRYNLPEGWVGLSATEEQDGSIQIRIANSARPIADELKPRLFERFSKSKNGGHGLGLNIAKEVIEAHGGRVWMEEHFGESMILFFVCLPR